MRNPDESFTIRTLGDQRRDRFHVMYAYCRNLECGHTAQLDLEALIAQIAEDFLLQGLHAVLRCQPCKEAGRNNRNCRFHYSSTYASSSNAGG